ncbi:CbbQ/NirQ/NorQ/GpvN family protein [Marinicella rhabdoformis]|uniref:CbbQ/NirQ/NorQ/GpvN family protein n=1 Tax=Marinicella rhabdoformis TaxID=2580566 RepID=UPI0012AEBF18|nr:CbbQ/NirQ/NorQ/GpvN family protein [Marinicella rhabdoformis]
MKNIQTIKHSESAAESHEKAPFYQAVGNELELFTTAWQNQLPVLLKGPTGCGKTRFVQHMADQLGKKLYTVACHEDLTASDLIGRHLIGDGKTYWQDGPLTKAVREGAICYLDEVVEARKDSIVAIHPLTDDRRILPIERTGELLQAPDGFMLVVSYNPGYQNLLKGMKPSTRQRFVSMRFDYPDAELEANIIQKESGCTDEWANQLAQLAQQLRQLKDHDLEESVSTRLLIYAATLITHGMPAMNACEAAIAEALSDDETVVEALMQVTKAHIG